VMYLCSASENKGSSTSVNVSSMLQGAELSFPIALDGAILKNSFALTWSEFKIIGKSFIIKSLCSLVFVSWKIWSSKSFNGL
jgi:hypothetical protein